MAINDLPDSYLKYLCDNQEALFYSWPFKWNMESKVDQFNPVYAECEILRNPKYKNKNSCHGGENE